MIEGGEGDRRCQISLQPEREKDTSTSNKKFFSPVSEEAGRTEPNSIFFPPMKMFHRKKVTSCEGMTSLSRGALFRTPGYRRPAPADTGKRDFSCSAGLFSKEAPETSKGSRAPAFLWRTLRSIVLFRPPQQLLIVGGSSSFGGLDLRRACKMTKDPAPPREGGKRTRGGDHRESGVQTEKRVHLARKEFEHGIR